MDSAAGAATFVSDGSSTSASSMMEDRNGGNEKRTVRIAGFGKQSSDLTTSSTHTDGFMDWPDDGDENGDGFGNTYEGTSINKNQELFKKMKDNDNQSSGLGGLSGLAKSDSGQRNNRKTNGIGSGNGNGGGNDENVGDDDLSLGSSTNSDDISDDDSSVDSTSWSLNVRLNSVVDLPPSIVPTIPLCPQLKFGLITLHNDDELQELEMASSLSRRQEYEQSKDEKMKVLPQTSLRLSSGILSKFQNNTTLVDCSKLSLAEDAASELSPEDSRSSPNSTVLSIKHSSGKIMCSKDSGMMEWHEEIRWDSIQSPLQTVLAIELTAQAILPPSTGSGTPSPSNSRHGLGDASRGGGGMTSKDLYSNDRYENTKHHTSNKKDAGAVDKTTNNNGDDPHGSGRGILGLWRRGKQTIGRRIRNRDGVNHTGNDSESLATATTDSQYDNNDNREVVAVTSHLSHTYLGSDRSDIGMEPRLSANDGVEKSKFEFTNLNGNPGDMDASIDKHGHAYGDLRLGTLLIPISNLPLEEEIPRVEKWYQFDTDNSGSDGKKSPQTAPWQTPSVLLDITLCTPTTLDAIEDEVYAALATGEEDEQFRSLQSSTSLASIDANNSKEYDTEPRDSFNSKKSGKRRRSVVSADDLLNEEVKDAMEKKIAEEEERIKQNGPYLEPGIVDHICVIGARDIGAIRNDNGEKGWVESELDCCVLEQFPPDEVHKSNGREDCILPHKIEWWCFPEGCKIWRGTEPPTHMDMNLKRFSASSPPRMASSIAAFDACLNCTSSFMWWVMSSISDKYGSSISKTYGAVIRFYAPIPQKNAIGEDISEDTTIERLWCPMAICLTSGLPIVGILEALLLRLCEKLASAGGLNSIGGVMPTIHADILDLILNYQRPMPGVVNCSIPFLSSEGDRLLVSMPPVDSLPPLPHGASVTSVCRLLGAEGLTALLAAVLTECKILIHSADVANLAMVGEVITALMYPFQWQLPFIPVLPISMIEVVEAPVSYFIGIPSYNMKWVDKASLSDVVVIDLDNGFSSDYFDVRRSTESLSAPNPLPASVSSNISKAIFRLLREEEEVQEHYGASNFSDTRHLPRLEVESLAEREFRITVAHQICGLIRGYQECLFFVSASQPVFNRDRFLRQAPALFEERKRKLVSSTVSVPSISVASNSKILSPRSKRFLSGLVNSAHFHALLEKLDSDVNSFFHEVMETFQDQDEEGGAMHSYGSSTQRAIVNKLKESLEEFEQQVPTFLVHRHHLIPLREEEDTAFEFIGGYFSSFTSTLLQSADSSEITKRLPDQRRLSLRELVERDKLPWVYRPLFDVSMKPLDSNASSLVWKLIHLKEALGERKFKVWKASQESDESENPEVNEANHGGNRRIAKSALDLTKLISNVRSDEMAVQERNRNFVSKLKRGAVADKDVIKRYIERAYEIVESETPQKCYSLDAVAGLFSDITGEVDLAMKNASAQRFLISILSQRSRLQNENRRTDNKASLRPGYNIEVSTSRLHPLVFDCLFCLCHSMLEACLKDCDYQGAYRLLIHTTGFCTTNNEMEICYMTKQVASHPIYADLRLWDCILLVHQQDRQRDKPASDEGEKKNDENDVENDNYEAAVSTLYEMLGYGMPADDLGRFAYHVARAKFYGTDREQKLLTLARRLAAKCEEANPDDILNYEESDSNIAEGHDIVARKNEEEENRWEEITWSHATSSILEQSPITALASFGSDIVATGALDGSIFLARTSPPSCEIVSQQRQSIQGTHLTFRSEKQSTPSGSSHSGQEEFSLGAISCLTSIPGFSDERVSGSKTDKSKSEPVPNCHLVGGTTGGKIAIWSVKDILASDVSDFMTDGGSMTSSDYTLHSGDAPSSHVRGTSNTRARKRERARKGRTLGEHRGGVTCTSIPPQIYRPDSLISGGNDGLIKLWSIRPDPTARNRRRASMGGRTSRMLFSGTEKNPGKDTLDVLAGHGGKVMCVETAWHGDRLLSGAADRTVKLWDLASQSGGRCLHTMHGHTGPVTHGRYWGRNIIVSASSDRSIALWDTRISGSSPLFVMRWHRGPISDLYLEPEINLMASAGADGSIATWDFKMMMQTYTNEQAKLATTSFSASKSIRNMGASSRNMGASMASMPNIGVSFKTLTTRQPSSHMSHVGCNSGPILLGKGSGRSIMSVSVDQQVKEWDAMNGTVVNEYKLQHTNKISCFKTFTGEECATAAATNATASGINQRKHSLGGYLTGSWDGTVRFRRILPG